MSDALLSLNAGSSSLKFALYHAEAEPALVAHGQIEGIGGAAHLIARDPAGATLTERRWPEGERQTHEDFLRVLLDWVDAHLGTATLAGVGHRVVHGGQDFAAPVLVDDAVLTALDRLALLAPLHQKHSLTPIRAIAAMRPRLPQVACFDTAFHHGHAAVVDRVALPDEFVALGVRRYGFHGLSYEYIAARLRQLAPGLAAGRVVVAHLGNGASLCAMHDGRSVDTTMSFTALDGLVMGTRCGALDPGVILYLLQERHMDAGQIEDLLYRHSGLLGVSGISGDMRTLVASGDARARAAIDLFVLQVARQAGAMLAALGGIDGIVFTAGIGEHTPSVRAAVCERLAWLGIDLDPAANAAGEGRISRDASHVAVWVIPTDEEAMIARHTSDTIRAAR